MNIESDEDIEAVRALHRKAMIAYGVVGLCKPDEISKALVEVFGAKPAEGCESFAYEKSNEPGVLVFRAITPWGEFGIETSMRHAEGVTRENRTAIVELYMSLPAVRLLGQVAVAAFKAGHPPPIA